MDGKCQNYRRERREHRVFTKLLQMVPGLEERLMSSSEEEVVFIADMVSANHSPCRFIHAPNAGKERCIEC
jgi:hypothetical protein